jgi:hypothetical protein
LDGRSARRKASTYTEHNTEKTRIYMHASSGIRTRDPSVRVAEDSVESKSVTLLRISGKIKENLEKQNIWR